MAKRRPLFESLEARLCMAGPTLQTTFSLPSAGSWSPTVYRASPIFVDIFGTGKDDLIAVAVGAKLVAYAENPDGSARAVVTYQVPGGVADIQSTPIVVTDPRTGRKDLFAAMGRDQTRPGTLEDGRVFGWDLQTGALLPGWTNGVSTGKDVVGESGVYGALTSGPLENNGMPDIVVTSFSTNVTALRLDGSVLWQWTNDDTIESGAVIGDIDRDGKPEVIVGGDSSNSSYYQAGGWVNVLSSTGILKWRKFIPGEVAWSSPVLADLKNNGYLDIVIGTGLSFQNENALGRGNYPNAQAQGNLIYALDPFGNVLPGWPYATTFAGDPVPHEVLAAPAVADLLGNGQLEVVALDRAGYIHVIQPDGTDLPGFEGGKFLAPEFTTTFHTLPPDDYASPTIADINGDGRPEIIGTVGPFVRAFDASGHLINITTTYIPPGGSPEGVDIAPAIGNFDGGGGLTLAYVSYNAQLQNRPDRVQIFRLPASTLAPPWPSIRRTVGGVAVARSTVFDRQYVASAFNALVGSIPGQATLQPYINALDSDAISLLTAAQLIAGGASARQAEVQRVYQSFLGHAADAYSVASWSTYLATHTYRQMEVVIASSGEFAQRAGSNLGQEITVLYRAILGRAPSQADINGWVASRQPVGGIAAALANSPEAFSLQLRTFYQAAFGAQYSIPADASAAFAYDMHRGAREDVAFSEILASNGNYAATNFVAGYIEDVYRDVLRRDAPPGDVAYWLGSIDRGSVAFGNFAGVILNSAEARGLYVQAEYQALLGHAADPSTVAGLQNYAKREDIVVRLAGSAEYYRKNGGTAASFVQAAFRDLGGIGITQSTINSFVSRINAGTSRAAIAQQIITGGTLYYNNTVVNLLMVYLPDEHLGVLRSGNLPPTAAGQPINPDPGLIAHFVGLKAHGYSDEQVIAILLNSPTYLNRVSYYKGLYRKPGIRN